MNSYASLLFYALMFLSFQVQSQEIINFAWQQWIPVGKAELRWGFWKIYDSELRTPSGDFKQAQRPLALIINYHRNIDAKDLLDATIEQWQHLGFNQKQLTAWRALMQNAWPDVKKGDRLIYLLNENGQFFFQAKQKQTTLYSELSNKALSNAFIDIWLSPNTSYPKLRKGLMGKKEN